MGCRRCQDKALATLRKQVCQFAALAAVVCHDMTLIDDDDIPTSLLDIMTELGVVLESVDGDDGLVVLLERVLVCRNLRANPVDTDAVESPEGNREPVPHLFLELGQDGFQRDN